MLDQIDRYQVKELIREDIWGSVYRAWDPKFARNVALQILNPSFSEKPEIKEDYLQLARTILRWRHPGIVRFFDLGESQDHVYSIQEYNPGPNLNQIINQMQTLKVWLSLSEVIQLIYAICQALSYAHQRGVKHLNITPENILLRPESKPNSLVQPIVINLGLGSNLQTNKESHLIPENEIYQDIRSVGKLLFLLICGTALVEEHNLSDGETYQTSISTQLRKNRPDLPHSLERMTIQALSTESQSGYSSIQDFGNALNQAISVAQRIHSVPEGYKNVTTLDAMIQGSVKPESQENFEADPSIPAQEEPEITKDIIHILLPDQTVKSVPFNGQSLLVGRDPDNDIVLNETGVSRKHARIEYGGQDYQVTDLNSTNGVFIDEVKLSPETPHIWLPGENLRIGDVWLRVEKAEQELSTMAIPSVQVTQKIVKEEIPPETKTDESSEKPFLGVNPISAFTIDTSLLVSPGKSISAPVVVYNRSTKNDVFYLEVNGLPDEWVVNRIQSTQVPAGGQKEITLTFRPPRAYTSRAGRHSLVLRITSQNNPSNTYELRLALTISAFTQFSSELQSKQIKAGDTGQLVLRNMGNIPETFTLSWEDRLGELTFDPRVANATVPPGETVKIPYQVNPASTMWFGGEKINSYKVNISSQSAQAQSHTGTVFSKALIPPWALILLIFLCLISSCLVVVFTNQFLGNGPDTQATQRASQTAGAISMQETAQVVTGTASAILSANQATIQAVTATAIWRELDSDNDGLTNGQEILLNTNPESIDTDIDGLSDGDEVNLYRSNPIIADSDGDGLKDGEEIQKRTDPLRRDTDGDGLEDSVDPDPLQASTPTQKPTTTSTTTPTISPTVTITSTPTYPPNIANLSLTLTNNTASSIPGTNTAYSLQVRNQSPIPVSNVQIIDTFPSILTNVTWNCVASPGSVCQTASGLGNLDTRVNLAASGAVTFTISASIIPTANGVLINTASIGMPAGITDPDSSNNQAMDTDNLTPLVNLSISKTDNRASVEPGQKLTYVINVNNAGPSSVMGLGVTDYFSDHLTDITWECNASSGSNCAVNGSNTGNINTDVNLSPAGNASFKIDAKVKESASGVLTNTASLISPINPSENNKSATDTTTINPRANLAISVSAPTSVSVSTEFTMTIRVTNLGPSSVSGLTLVDGLPDNSVFSSSEPGAPICVWIDDTLNCSLGSLAAGAEKDIKIIIIAPMIPGKITNIANITANQIDPDLSNNQESTEILIY